MLLIYQKLRNISEGLPQSIIIMVKQFLLRKFSTNNNFIIKFFWWVYFSAAFYLIFSWVTSNSDCSTEISQLYLPVSKNENVLRLQVKVHTILRVQVLESHHCSNCDVKEFFFWKILVQLHFLLLLSLRLFLWWFSYPTMT